MKKRAKARKVSQKNLIITAVIIIVILALVILALGFATPELLPNFGGTTSVYP